LELNKAFVEDDESEVPEPLPPQYKHEEAQVSQIPIQEDDEEVDTGGGGDAKDSKMLIRNVTLY